MLTSVRATIARYDLIRQGETICVALSGGADSVALLDVLLKLKDDFNITVCACHVNHQLRGEESDRDQRFVEALCKKLGVDLKLHICDIKAEQNKHESIEQVARKVRYRFFDSLDCKFATAHNANDNAETVLFNLQRGTALKGICGIPYLRDNIIRPLLDVTRSEIEQYCQENNLTYVTDSTNLSEDYTRNKIRRNIIPQFVELNPSFVSTVSRMTQAVSEENSFLEAMARSLEDSASTGDGYDIDILKTANKVVIKRLIAREFERNGIDGNRQAIDKTLELILQGSGKLNIAKNYFCQVKNNKFHLFFEKQSYRQR